MNEYRISRLLPKLAPGKPYNGPNLVYYQILRKAGFYIPAQGAGNRRRFSHLLRNAWLRIPRPHRERIMQHWEVGSQLVLWSPEIQLFNNAELLGACTHFGCALHFNAGAVDGMPNDRVEDLIGHEFAHSWHYSQADSHAGNPASTAQQREDEANDLADQWGFQMAALQGWWNGHEEFLTEHGVHYVPGGF